MGLECHHPEGPRPGLSGQALAAALGAAETRCALAHERLTAPRRRVLELLLSADGPMKAYDLIAAFAPDGAPAKPPTIYRALEFLERLGFAHRIESLNAYVPCKSGQRAHRAAFMICDCCGAAREFEPDFTAQLNAAQAAGFEIEAMTFEAHGLCGACRGA